MIRGRFGTVGQTQWIAGQPAHRPFKGLPTAITRGASVWKYVAFHGSRFATLRLSLVYNHTGSDKRLHYVCNTRSLRRAEPRQTCPQEGQFQGAIAKVAKLHLFFQRGFADKDATLRPRHQISGAEGESRTHTGYPTRF